MTVITSALSAAAVLSSLFLHTVESTGIPLCHFKIKATVAPYQNEGKSRFDKLWVNGAVPGGGGTPDMLLDGIGSVFCYNGSVMIEDRGPVRRFSQGFAYLQVPDDKSTAWNRVVAEGYATSVGNTHVDGGSWIIGEDRRIGYAVDRPLPWARWKGFMVCNWWHFKPQLFYYTDAVTNLNKIPLDCGAVDLWATSLENEDSEVIATVI